MEFFELIQKRQSIRAFRDLAIDPEMLEKILSAANLAPSAGNLQAYEIFVVQEAEQKNALVPACRDQDFVAEAPVVLIFCAHPSRTEWRYHERGVKLYALQDATIACCFAMLAATELGLGTVWIGAFNDEDVSKVLGLSPDLIPVAILPIGYPAETPPHRPRRQLEDLVHFL